jgi:para-aminobenzoate synthetase
MTTLLIDNYDSYTYNVFHLLAAVTGEEPVVVHNDAISWRALSRWDFDAIVLSPGPGRPERWHDFGVCADILRRSTIPVLGICLGHQGIGRMLDGAVASAPVVMHGRLSRVRHDGAGLFAGLPQGFSVVRYHSLVVGDQLGPDGHVSAWTDEGIVMGIEHRRRPIWGVQFHPESVASEHGRKLVENFYARARAHNRSRSPEELGAPPPRPRRTASPQVANHAEISLLVRRIDGTPSTEQLFEALFADRRYAFWLDSVDAPTRLAQRSFLGTSAGADRRVLEYDVERKSVAIDTASGRELVSGSIFEVLDREMASRALVPTPDMPQGLLGGFVGYLGYECKADCGSPNIHRANTPDAVFMFANRIVSVDHSGGCTHLLALHDGDATEATRWLDQAEAVVRELLRDQPGVPQQSVELSDRGLSMTDDALTVSFRCGRGRDRYLEDIARCKVALEAGESYEVCLTDHIHTDAEPDAFQLYKILRRRNPAPFSAYLKLGELAVASSSPERFIGIDRDGVAQARPIKGTSPRSGDAGADEANRVALLEDEKTFAEHLMIVDLLRNDLGRVCEMDSVRVPELMVVEPYTTVHQLISTITGRIDKDYTPVQCVHACFPGGSMTGAPKIRTMGIIDDIEREARGVYSGAIGYFSLEGSVDLSIVIRTVVMRPGSTTIGAGGAIVAQSDPQEEFDELLLKARAPMAAVAEAITGTRDPASWSVEFEEALPAATS